MVSIISKIYTILYLIEARFIDKTFYVFRIMSYKYKTKAVSSSEGEIFSPLFTMVIETFL